MRRPAMLAVLLAPVTVSADNLWLEAAGSSGSADGSRLGFSRSLDNLGLHGVTAGLAHNQVADSWWTTVDAGLSRRLSARWIVSGKAQIGPGQLAGENFSYRKLNVGATWLWSKHWSVALSDSYVNVDTTIGHVFSASLTRHQAGYSVSVHGVASAGSAIDNQQLGASIRWQRDYTVIGGLFAGRTSNPATLRQVGTVGGTAAADMHQAYVGISRPFGRFTLLGVLDYLKLGDATRQEISLVVTVPLRGSGGGQ